MLSLYLKQYARGQLKVTFIRKIHGDIWQLHRDIKKFVEEKEGMKIASQVSFVQENSK